MNRNKLKTYAPEARRAFIEAIRDRAAFYGLTADKTEPVTINGHTAMIGGRVHPLSVATKRKSLDERVAKSGYEPTIEAIAYTWFNRFIAIRFMELHGYLDHGYRVLSHPEGKPTPEIIDHAEHVDLRGLNRGAVIDLKLAGNREAELYRCLLIAQCNALNEAMPFLFERIDDETELLLPDNLLLSDSLIRKLVEGTDEEDWQEVEVIGWLYQFYISEKKDQVIGKVVASEDIPAATQLFTPNWIVKYLVQNTLGRQWLATYPQSSLRSQMEYYIEPAEQTPEVQEQLKAITPDSLNPEEMTLLDPACGSGHILVEAYELFKSIYQERGYRAKDIPALILEKNLFGLEIDGRAAQLAAFALMMKARADDRRIFDNKAKPNIIAFQDSTGMNAADITHALNSPINNEPVKKEVLFEDIDEENRGLFSRKILGEKGHVSEGDIASLFELFENAKTFGSLIQVPLTLAANLPEIEKRLDDVLKFGDLTHASAYVIQPLLTQARILGRQYDAVVANPPYMGSRYYSAALKAFINNAYKESKADLYACFILRDAAFATPNGFFGLITIPNWMFLSTFEEVRSTLFNNQTIDTFIHNGRGVFGSDFGSCSFVYRNAHLPQFRGTYRRLFAKQGSVASNEELDQRFNTVANFTPSSSDLVRIPGSPVAYWLTEQFRQAFSKGKRLGTIAEPRQGMATADNLRFLRGWQEVNVESFGRGFESRETAKQSGKTWFPYNKGGPYRRWYGNNEWVVNWHDDGAELFANRPTTVIRNSDYYFKPCITWTDISSSSFAARLSDAGHLFDVAGSGVFPPKDLRLILAGLMCSKVAFQMLLVLNPTMHFQVGNIANLPVMIDELTKSKVVIDTLVSQLAAFARLDWDSFETSWDFQTLPVLRHSASTLLLSQEAADAEYLTRFSQMKSLEEENNRFFIEVYGLQNELSPEVADDQITLYRPDRTEDIKRLISYAIGCMMGRYSLDKPGLTYAQSGNRDFDSTQYASFRADDDGIIPLFDTDWGIPDDATNRVIELVGVAWPKEHLEENLKFIADSLGPNANEQPRETIRRYVTTAFYKHHLSMYKKRPIYWLFSSGKQRAFQCLVYLHRYNEGTLSRMRTEYVIPLLSRITARIGDDGTDAGGEGKNDKGLLREIEATKDAQLRKKYKQELERLKKQRVELRKFDEILKQKADEKITLNLDDGVKVNYGKFGDLLAEVKSITGGKDDE